MSQLRILVVPKIMDQWEEFASASLNYDAATIESIKQKKHGDPKQCCEELLEDWLDGKHGDGPRDWSTLLAKLKWNVEETGKEQKQKPKDIM